MNKIYGIGGRQMRKEGHESFEVQEKSFSQTRLTYFMFLLSNVTCP